jgi:hypothetical protein
MLLRSLFLLLLAASASLAWGEPKVIPLTAHMLTELKDYQESINTMKNQCTMQIQLAQQLAQKAQMRWAEELKVPADYRFDEQGQQFAPPSTTTTTTTSTTSTTVQP